MGFCVMLGFFCLRLFSAGSGLSSPALGFLAPIPGALTLSPADTRYNFYATSSIFQRSKKGSGCQLGTALCAFIFSPLPPFKFYLFKAVRYRTPRHCPPTPPPPRTGELTQRAEREPSGGDGCCWCLPLGHPLSSSCKRCVTLSSQDTRCKLYTSMEICQKTWEEAEVFTLEYNYKFQENMLQSYQQFNSMLKRGHSEQTARGCKSLEKHF